MKDFWVLFLLFLANFGFAQSYNNVTLLDNWSNDNLTTASEKNRYNDCWAFVYKEQEFAVIGSTEGTHFFLINDQNKLIEKGFVKGKYAHASVVHRDFKTYKNYLYSVCDEGSSSLQIIDFQHLPDSVHLVADIEANFGRIHTIFIDTNHALLYAFGLTLLTNGQPISTASMKVYSLSNPLLPTQVFGGFGDLNYVHDGVVNNNIAILNCGFDGLRRYDFSNPSAPLFLQNLSIYQDQGYNHQGESNPSGDVYIFGDETNGKKLKKCTIEANGDIKIQSYFGTNYQNGSVPHNIMLDERFAYVAYYNQGLRIYDYRSSPVEEIAFYDTYPDASTYQMNGLWGIYSGLPSERIVASDRKYGLFLFDFNRKVFSLRTDDSFQVYPNPLSQGQNLTVFINEYYKGALRIKLIDFTGREVYTREISKQNFMTFQPDLSAGTYQLQLTYEQNQETKIKVFPLVIY